MNDKFIMQQIKKLKPAMSLEIDPKERPAYSRVARMMRHAGMIEFRVSTRRAGNKFRVFAV